MASLKSILKKLSFSLLFFLLASLPLFSLTQSEREIYQKILDEYKISINSLLIQVDALEQTHQTSETQRKTLLQRVQILQQQVATLQALVDKLNNQSATLTQQSKDLTTQNQNLTNDLETLDLQLEDLKKAVQTLKNDLKGIEFENFTLKVGIVGTGGLAITFAILYFTKK